MRAWFRDIRILPILLTAAGGLLFLKTLGLLLDGGYLLAPRSAGNDSARPVPQIASGSSAPIAQFGNSSSSIAASPSPVRNSAFGGPNIRPSEVTGSVASKPAEKKEETAKKDQAEPPPAPESRAAQGTPVQLDPQRPPSASERALLERLQQRRLELEMRARDLDMRENLVKATEKSGETNPGDVSASQNAGGNGSAGRKEDPGVARLKSVVTMYETMKPKDAAKIFDRLDPKVLLEVASQIKPQRMSEILASMTTETAERLTVELATRGVTDRAQNPANLPKIEGKPGN